MRKPSIIFTTGIYRVIAGMINSLPAECRQTVADHFATEFNRRSAKFDPIQWNRLTGGRPAPNSAHK